MKIICVQLFKQHISVFTDFINTINYKIKKCSIKTFQEIVNFNFVNIGRIHYRTPYRKVKYIMFEVLCT